MPLINYVFLSHPNIFRKRATTKAIILHHAVMNGSVEDVNAVHLKRQFNGIGYHLYVRKDGSIYGGRPIEMVGAGIRPSYQGYSNSNTVHICAEGNFMVDTMSTKQLNGIVTAIEYLRQHFGNVEIKQHRQVNATACPGNNYPVNKILLLSLKEVVMEKKYRVTIPTNKDNYLDVKREVEQATGYKFYVITYKLRTTASEYALKRIVERSPYKVYFEEIK